MNCSPCFFFSLFSVFWPHMQAYWALLFSSNWSPRSRPPSQKSDYVSTLKSLHLIKFPNPHALLLLQLTRGPHCVLTGVHFDHHFYQLGVEEGAGRACNKIWLFGFPVLTIKNMYVQNFKKKHTCFIYSVEHYKRLWYRHVSHVLNKAVLMAVILKTVLNQQWHFSQVRGYLQWISLIWGQNPSEEELANLILIFIHSSMFPRDYVFRISPNTPKTSLLGPDVCFNSIFCRLFSLFSYVSWIVGPSGQQKVPAGEVKVNDGCGFRHVGAQQKLLGVIL